MTETITLHTCPAYAKVGDAIDWHNQVALLYGTYNVIARNIAGRIAVQDTRGQKIRGHETVYVY
jgi:hypothetical protein